MGLTRDGEWYCLWYMPFASRAVLEVGNDGQEARELSFVVSHAPLPAPADQYVRFHAKWHRDALVARPEARAIDWPMLITEGRGRFVGVMLHVWNPRGGWWGEGDEKFFVDGEKFPSIFGTGSEDYFGYAWCTPALFENAFHNQTISMGNRGHISVNRWHIADDVPFQTSLEASIEKYYPNSKPTLYAAVAYWYLASGGRDPYRPVELDERVEYFASEPEPAVPGAIEAERMKVLRRTGGNVQTQYMTQYEGTWSRNAHLWWTGAGPRDKLDLALPLGTAGQYQIVAAMTKAVDYGIVQVYLDGRKLGEPIDLYNENVVPTGPMALGTLGLTAGEHTLTLEITGANIKAKQFHMVGLDYVKLEADRGK